MNHGIQKFSSHSSKKAKTKVNACMVKATAKRSRELGRFLFCFVFFFPWRKPNLNHLILLGKVVRRNRGTHFPDWRITKTSWEITLVSGTGGEEPALCSPPKPGNTMLLQGATSSPGPLQSQGRRTPSPPRCSSSTFLLHALLSQALLQAHLLLLINKSSLHKLTLIEARLRLRTAGLSLWVCLYIQHLFFHCLSSLHYVHRPRLRPSSGTAGATLRQSLFCSGTRSASWACKQETATDPQNIKICQTWVDLCCKSERLLLCLCTAPPVPPHLQHHSLTAVPCRERYRTALLPPLLTRCYSGPQWISLLSAKHRWPFPPFSKIANFCNTDLRMKLVSPYWLEHYQEKSSIQAGT